MNPQSPLPGISGKSFRFTKGVTSTLDDSLITLRNITLPGIRARPGTEFSLCAHPDISAWPTLERDT